MAFYVTLRAIVPKKFVSDTAVMSSINLRMFTVARAAKKALDDSVSDWSSPPEFQIRGSAQQGEVEIYTQDKRFFWVDGGTRPHLIRVRNKKVLAFRSGYTSKSKPNSLIRGSGQYSGGVVFRREVNHPGIKPRNIVKRIQEATQSRFRDQIQDAISKSVS